VTEHSNDARRFAAVAGSYGFEATKENLARWDGWQTSAYCAKIVPLVTSTYDHSAEELKWWRLLDEGAAILHDRARLVAAIVARRRTMRIGGHVVPVANCPPELASEVGEALIIAAAKEEEEICGCPQFSATYHDGPDRRRFTLCSPEGGADCGETARQMAKVFHEIDDHFASMGEGYQRTNWTASGTERSARFDAPLGWNGE
jgi:hypothetical protein